MQISLIRHANTINNQNDICTGHLNIPIIDTEKINFDNKFNCILSSPMLRCKQTLDILNINKNIIYDNRLIECGYGNLTGKKKNKEIFERSFFNKPEISPLFISESIFEAGLRSYNALNYHKKYSILDEDNILVLSHKNTLKGLWVFLKLEKMFYNKNALELNNFNTLKCYIEFIIENNEIPQFNNLELETILLDY